MEGADSGRQRERCAYCQRRKLVQWKGKKHAQIIAGHQQTTRTAGQPEAWPLQETVLVAVPLRSVGAEGTSLPEHGAFCRAEWGQRFT